MRRLLDWYLPALYFLRFPLLLAALLLLYVPFALFAVPAMFRSTLIVGPRGLAFVTMFALCAAVIVMTASRTIILCGPDRFALLWPRSSANLSRRGFAAWISLAAPLIATSAWLSASENQLGLVRTGVAVSTGVVLAAIFESTALAVHAWLVDRNETLPDLALPDTRTRFARFHRRPVPQRRFAALSTRLLVSARAWLGPGYFTTGGHIAPAHLFATGTFVVFGALYLGAYFLGKPAYAHHIPPLVFVLLLATFATVVLSGVAFFLDRHRVPVMLIAILWLTLMAWVSESDHYVHISRTSYTLTAPTPYEVARTRRPLLTVVAVDGGGIQAAAWSATVLTHLQHEWPAFSRSTGVISAASGGSVGTMMFVSSLRADRLPTDEELSGVVAAAARPSLSEVAWGLTYPDTWRAILPIGRFDKDRGWAMEQAWRRNFAAGEVPTLSHWIDGVRKGWMPSVALNATKVESGERFAFATFAPPDGTPYLRDATPWNLGTMLNTYPNHDIDMPTAARMSATFPYVTPIATPRSRAAEVPWHFADGGYYDNSGMGIAMRWLDTALYGDAAGYRNATVAFIRIRSSPKQPDSAPKERAWLYDAIGPLVTELNVRVAGQRERAETELEFLRQLWCQRGVTIGTFEFGFDLPRTGEPGMKNPPLSWQLTRQEIEDLDSAWKQPANSTALQQLLALTSGSARGSCAVR